uniref:Receptor ligand binding region domain-containing protein n=1 Tax=Latimeria chalumnae TaxID=7897 RepID=H3AKN6_LATCH
RFDIRGFVRSLAMIYTIESINNSTLLPGIKLGYEICDTCSDVSRAIPMTMKFLSKSNSTKKCVDVRCNYTNYIPTVKAVVGPGYSEISIAVSRILSFFLIPQISYASSAPALSEKTRFSSFLRTVPSDIHQTEALAKLVNTFHWNYVGIIGGDDDYGRSALEKFIHHAKNQSVCIEFQEHIPTYIDHKQSENKIQSIAHKIKHSRSATILLFVKGPLIIKLFTELLKQNVTRTWIASDVWSTSKEVARMKNIGKIGTILGLSFKNGNIKGFNEYLQNLRPGPDATNLFIEEYKKLRFGCTQDDLNYNCNDDYLVKNIEHGGAYGAYLAVTAIAQSLRNILKCQEGTCDRTVKFAPWQV